MAGRAGDQAAAGAPHQTAECASHLRSSVESLAVAGHGVGRGRTAAEPGPCVDGESAATG